MSEERSDEFLSGRRALPDKSSNAANPQGRVVGCPGGLLRGAGQAAHLGSPEKAKQGRQADTDNDQSAYVSRDVGQGMPRPYEWEKGRGSQPRSAPQIRTEIHITCRQNRLHPVMYIQLAQNR